MMKIFSTTFALALIVAGAFLSGQSPALAQEVASAKIILVDFNRVTGDSLVGQDVNAQIQQQASRIQTFETNLVAKFDTEEDELKRLQTVIAPDAWEERVRLWNQKKVNGQRQSDALRKNLQQVGQQAQMEIDRVLRPIVNNVMTARGATMVLDTRVVWRSAAGFDFTTEVVDGLNTDLASYKLAFMDIPEVPAE
ncbi:MAG: OmpH family outer membrane protein [Proteobacteria bacterium]|nr:OmpH family outer membrane protein [Pseudomonadota bacterium]